MTDYELKYDGGYYLDSGAHRTRLYINIEAAMRAVERGNVYTHAEYAAIVNTPATRRRVARRSPVVRLI